MTDPKNANVPKAVAVLTSWLNDPDAVNPEATGRVAKSYILEAGDGGDSLVAGMISVAGLLLLRLAAATEMTTAEILQDISARYGEGAG